MTFKQLSSIPLDPILGLVQTFNADTRMEKINLTIGIYADGEGKPTTLRAVRIAEEKIVKENPTKSYFPIKGLPQILDKITAHVLGETNEHVVTCYGSGGTGALRMAAEVMNQTGLPQRIWISNPTWELHNTLFKHCRFEVINYDWIAQHAILFDAFLATLETSSKPGDWVLLHASCHNPTGIDPTAAQWDKLLKTLQRLQLNPLFDVPYHGFGEGLAADIYPVRTAMPLFDEMIICYSFSKVMGLYNERCGAVIFKTDPALKKILDSNVQRMARLLFSNPPAHGLRIIDHVLGDATLHALWIEELQSYNRRLADMRSLFSQKLSGLGFEHIARGKGMFAMTGLNLEQVLQLRSQHGVYLLDNGRINIAGLNLHNIDRVTDAIKTVF